MKNQTKLAKEEFLKEFSKIVFPGWMKHNKKSHDFRNFVLDKHMILENLLDLLTVAYFFGKIESKKSESFRDIVLTKMSFAKKVEILQRLALINKKLKGLIFKMNDYRVSQAHIKRRDHLREPTKENYKLFQKISTRIYSLLAFEIMIRDKDLRKKVEKLISLAGKKIKDWKELGNNKIEV